MKTINSNSFTRWITRTVCVGAVTLSALSADRPVLDAGYLASLRGGDAAQLRAALTAGAPPNATDAGGNTPLMLAALYGGVDSMQALLDRGADVNATNRAGATALMRAAVAPAKVRLLLEHGANPNARTLTGQTALMLAARPANSHDAVALLLKHGADANAASVFGATALMAAAAGGDAETVRMLLAHGANPNVQANPDEPGFLFGGGRSPLMWAAFRGDTEIIQLLIAAGAEVNAPAVMGTPLAQAAWADRTQAAELLLANGAKTDIPGFMDGYQPLHWAASTDEGGDALVKLLLRHGANPDAEGGEPVDALMGTPQTPLMLARRHGNEDVINALLKAGATLETPDRVKTTAPPDRNLPKRIEADLLRRAISRAILPLHVTSLESKKSFVSHASKQDCTSCHQQHLPMAAMGLARQYGAKVNPADEAALIALVKEGEIKDLEIDWQPLFHPDPVLTKGYELLAYAAQNLPADENTDAWVHHLAAIQGPDGQWYNNLPRPPIQTGDIGATALAIHGLQRYPLPGRQAELRQRVARARQWLWQQTSQNTDSLAYQLLGLAWAGEPADRLQPLAKALLAQQHEDGGWAQLPGLKSDAYATGQAIYALRVAAGWERANPGVGRGIRFLLKTQLADGTWYVRRRAFPFQPTMNSHFPHGRDGWISAAGTSWAVMALSLPDGDQETIATTRAPGKTALVAPGFRQTNRFDFPRPNQ